jgi:hypothetical protein
MFKTGLSPQALNETVSLHPAAFCSMADRSHPRAGSFPIPPRARLHETGRSRQ